MTKEPSIQERIEKRLIKPHPKSSTQFEPVYEAPISELESLLEAYAKEIAVKAWNESNIITRIRANRAGCSKIVDNAMSDAVLEFDKWYASIRNAPSPTEKQ